MTNDSGSEPPEVPIEDRPINLPRLRQAIVDFFNENELRDLFFDLGVDYDNFPPGGKADKARELITYFKRRRRLNVLVITIRDLRPAITWEEITEEKAEEPATPQVTSLLDLTAAGKESTLVIGRSFTTLIKFMRSSEVRTAVVAFQTDFEAVSAQIDQLNDYKYAHDLFQELENLYFLVRNDQKRLPDDDFAWDSITINEPELQVKIGDLVECAQRATFVDQETRWVQQLTRTREQMRVAVEEYEFEKLQLATRLLYRVLNRQPSRLNAQLVATASTLRLDSLEEAMTIISNTLAAAELDLKATDEIREGVAALSGLDERLRRLVRAHDYWQELDDELRRVEATMDQGIEELEYAWFDLEPILGKLYEDETAEWVKTMQKVSTALEKALDDGNAITVRRFFRRFRSHASRQFRRVDLELLTLAQNLQKVGESLDLLLRSFR